VIELGLNKLGKRKKDVLDRMWMMWIVLFFMVCAERPAVVVMMLKVLRVVAVEAIMIVMFRTTVNLRLRDKLSRHAVLLQYTTI
jgi:hypothetical protein